MIALSHLTMPASPGVPGGRYGVRAPRGGCTAGGKVFKGGQFCLPYDPGNPHGLSIAAEAPGGPSSPMFDVTARDGVVTIANPRTGGSRTFKVETMVGGGLDGRRVASVLMGDDPRDRFAWAGFAFADSFGLKPWRRTEGDPAVTGKGGFIALLTEAGRFAGRLEYRVEHSC